MDFCIFYENKFQYIPSSSISTPYRSSINKRGDKRFPCLKILFVAKKTMRSPFTIKEKRGLEMKTMKIHENFRENLLSCQHFFYKVSLNRILRFLNSPPANKRPKAPWFWETNKGRTSLNCLQTILVMHLKMTLWDMYVIINVLCTEKEHLTFGTKVTEVSFISLEVIGKNLKDDMKLWISQGYILFLWKKWGNTNESHLCRPRNGIANFFRSVVVTFKTFVKEKVVI